MSSTAQTRVDRASRVIAAPALVLYRAFVDPVALAVWLPPEGMTARVEAFDAREGGRFRLVLVYSEPGAGKSAADSDIVEGRFIALVPGARVVQDIDFVSGDPAFAGTMRMTWSFTHHPDGTLVAIACENVPTGIRPEDHDVGLRSSLDNLAAYMRGRAGT
ncbi:SRPBCC domain-containing protein [Shinella kummerowiae]|uniref:SRPBCC domain-containing protein n=1 Tax=Shinella kummerowiae TaxID=417745 RepID=UPI0021B6957F|nr:SRPBCC domain-containing protein [Shinella kummerowiae]MCT7665114.1 SRPBCC domain-containing protein [Shinella kummerowiae]